MDIGLISDTHGLLRPEALAALQGCAHILHAGDIGSERILEALRRLAPVTAVRGNNDIDAWASAIAETAMVELAGRRLYLLHDRKALDFDPAARDIAAVISGHSHQPGIETRGGVLYVNPGSAGPRRFRLPVSLARLQMDADGLRAEILPLGESQTKGATASDAAGFRG